MKTKPSSKADDKSSRPTRDLPDATASLLEFAERRKRQVKLPITLNVDEEVLAYYRDIGIQSVEEWIEQVASEWVMVRKEYDRRRNRIK